MKKLSTYLTLIRKFAWPFICGVLMLIILLQRQCTPEPPKPGQNTHTVDTTYDTIPYYDTIPVHTPAQTVHDTVFPEFPFDTLELIADYFKIIISTDTLKGENYEIAIRDEISRNRIQKRKATAKINVIKETIHQTDSIFYTTDCPKVRNKIYAGFGIGGWTDKIGFAPAVALNTKKDHLYTLSYDLINQTVWLQVYWKIKLRK